VYPQDGAFSPDLAKTRLKSRVYRFGKNAAEKPHVPIWQKTRLKSRVYRFGKNAAEKPRVPTYQ